MIEIRVRQLGLAAFVKMNGVELSRVVGKEFIFNSDVPLSEWRVRYDNSCCQRHDSLVCDLRRHLKKD